jgi:RHS repeat-associated protein
VTKVVNGQVQVVRRHDYKPFGEEVAPQNPPVDKRLFTGKERDQETGWDYFGARYLRADLGRFTTIDPVQTWKENLVDPQRWNRYGYAKNGPLRYMDPTGLYTCSGSKGDCGQIDAYIRRLRDSLKGLDPKSDGHKKVTRTLNYFGPKDKKNGVVFEPTALPGDVLGQGDPGGLIKVDLSHIKAEAEQLTLFNSRADGDQVTLALGAAVLGHEGRHELDFTAFGPFLSRDALYRTELNAWTTESYVFQGLAVNGTSWMSVWTAAQRRAVIEAGAQRAVDWVWRDR